MELLDALARLSAKVGRLKFGPPAVCVYNPLDYAWPVVKAYVERWGRGPKEAVLLGMNPGPFGMGQTGIPFGEVAAVRDYLKLTGEIRAPKKMHAKRPVEGFACTRAEVSGQRLWGAIAERHPEPDTFFARAFVLNYCPLLFLGETGANVTPDKLAKEERARMEAVCDASLAEVLGLLAPRCVIGVGQYAAKRAALVFGGPIFTMPHPSPASPAANRGWAELARSALERDGVHGLL